MKSSLRIIPPRSSAKCCATCSQWYATTDGVWCAVAEVVLSGDLAGLVCDRWQREEQDTEAVEVYRSLSSGVVDS